MQSKELNEYAIFRNGTQQGHVMAKSLEQAQDIVDCANGGGKATVELVDLFEYPERLPKPVQEIIEGFGEVETYDQCEQMQKELEKVGFTFDYYLDAVPFDLRKI